MKNVSLPAPGSPFVTGVDLEVVTRKLGGEAEYREKKTKDVSNTRIGPPG